MSAFMGQDVITTRAQLLNNLHTTCPAKVTHVGGTGPNGGTLVNLMVFPDGAAAVPLGILGVEWFEYPEDAQELADGAGCWPIQ